MRAGSRHPLTLLGEEIVDFFRDQGYGVADGPEVEAEWFNFDGLNMDEAHVARAPDHTFYLLHPDDPAQRSGLVMRAHTSPVQLRALLRDAPPLYRVHIGRTYRPDPLDATHSPVFNQIEGFAVDRALGMDDLQATLNRLASAMFGEGIVTRLRPDWFAYAEPAAEIDVQCVRCRGQHLECATCGGEGWIEWGGCGLIHAAVLRNCGVNPDEYRGFAFGMGLERTLMLREGLHDLRHVVDGDLRFALGGRDRARQRNGEASFVRRAGQALADAGCVETPAFPFFHADDADRLRWRADDPHRRSMALVDPLPGCGGRLRTSLMPGLLHTLKRNLERGADRPLLFEVGRVFQRPAAEALPAPRPAPGARPAPEQLRALDAALPHQPRHLAVAFCGHPEWNKAIALAETVAGLVPARLDTVPGSPAPWLAEHSVALSLDGAVLGHAGRLDADVLAAWQLPPDTCALELDLQRLHPHLPQDYA